MTITTKYNPGDKVFFAHISQVIEGTIWAIVIPDILGDTAQICYNIVDKDNKYHLINGSSKNFREESLFPSKEELIKSL